MCGFEVNRFVDLSESVSKHLICSICLNIFRNAIRSECEHNFCRQCVGNWIKSNKNYCPECRKAFIKRKRNLRTSCDDNTLIVCDFVFKTNLMANNLINELKIKCDFESNGCKEVIELGLLSSLLSSHLKECQHKICKNCGFPFREHIEHIPQKCIERLKNDKNESKKKLNEINEKFNELKEKYLKLENKVKQLERLPPIPTTTSSLYDSIPELSLEPIKIFFGSLKS